MLYEQGAVSRKPWEPVGNIRRRPAWVQTTVFDLLRQVRALRIATAKLPSIDIISLPSHRQLAVSFGDLNALCDSIEFVLRHCGPLGVAYGGPDDRGTLWIKFYKMLSQDRTPENQLQFIIWINSVRQPTIALEERIKSVYEHIRGPIWPVEPRFLYCQQQVPYLPMRSTQTKALEPWGEEHTVREYLRHKAESEGYGLWTDPTAKVSEICW